MRRLDGVVVARQLDQVMETLEAEGPLVVQENGEDVGVLVSPEFYARLLAASQRSVGNGSVRTNATDLSRQQ